MLVKTFGGAVHGVDAIAITVEMDLTDGDFGYSLVGLPDNAVREGQYRIEAAMKNSHLRMPRKRLVINMAPADIRKEGAAYDVTIAAAILAASGQVPHDNIHEYVIMGELSLDGSLQPIKGALPIAIQARKEGFKGIILPIQNAREAAIVNNLEVYGIENLEDLAHFFRKTKVFEAVVVDTRDEFAYKQNENDLDFSDVKGQENIKRAMEIAAAGGHNIILVGAPGSGKTMLSKRLPTILPPLSLHEALETTKIHSVAGRLQNSGSLVAMRPFRAPHHTISDVALVGGGNVPQPGEISLAHNGVLFLDELPEFKRTALEVMRQPLEERRVTISRAKFTVEYPASFMLVASMNPCPCGYHNHPERKCVCPPGSAQKYLNKISGPLMDRIDIHIEVSPVNFDKLLENTQSEKSENIRQRVIAARQVQLQRYLSTPETYANAQMTTKQLREHCKITPAGQHILKVAMERLGLSARAYDRILKVARTIADLDAQPDIDIPHLAEAIQYRSLDRENWLS